MTAFIRCLGFANGTSCPHEGWYVKSFDHEAYEGRGYAEFTQYQHEAMQFNDVSEAMEFWQRRAKCRPLRPDGKPNRPMTSMHAEIIKK